MFRKITFNTMRRLPGFSTEGADAQHYSPATLAVCTGYFFTSEVQVRVNDVAVYEIKVNILARIGIELVTELVPFQTFCHCFLSADRCPNGF